MATSQEVEKRPPRRLPSWFKVPMPGGPNFNAVQDLLQEGDLHTVCQEARCPNIGECWEERSATIMILGDICTRRCHYCAVKTGRPSDLDLEEPHRLARTVERLGFRHVASGPLVRRSYHAQEQFATAHRP